MTREEKENLLKDMVVINNRLKDLSERVENIEKQIKEDKEERLKKLKAELNYAKFRCALQQTESERSWNFHINQ